MSPFKIGLDMQGLEGLKDLPPIHKTHPQTTPPEIAEQIVSLSLAHPAWGCVRLAAYLKLQGMTVSSPTIQSILIKQGIGSRFERLLKLEEKVASEPIDLSAEQITAIEEANPCFRERHVQSSAPGELLAQDTFLVGSGPRRWQGLFAHGGRNLWLVRLWFLAYGQTPRMCRSRAPQ